MKQYLFDALFRDSDPDPAGDLSMIEGHARLAGWYGLPRQEYADADAEKAAIDGYERGRQAREESRRRADADDNANVANIESFETLCEACGASDADFHHCEGCGCCQECCNCTESDCDCDACTDRRGA